MPYEYLEKMVTSDIAFHAWGVTVCDLFKTSGDALIGVMVDSIESVEPKESRSVALQNDSVEMLLFDALQELIYFKDAQGMLLRYTVCNIEQIDAIFTFRGEMRGEQIEESKHNLMVDVKAVTMHLFAVTEKKGCWEATVVLDI